MGCTNLVKSALSGAGTLAIDFFFSSRRRHTISKRDWSSDVCSSDLFPSGHASITFASATVIERHLGWKYSVLGYVIASYVAASRLHDNRHYLSDVIFGAAVGSIAGRTVVHHASDYWAVAPVRVPGGVAILITRAAP